MAIKFITRRSLSVAATALLSLGCVASARYSSLAFTDSAHVRKSATTLTGDQLLRKSAAAYAALHVYRGTVTSNSIYKSTLGSSNQTATAQIDFRRDQHMYIAGKLAGGGTYHIASAGKKTTLTWTATPGRKETAQPVASLQLAIASMTGVGALAPTIIPGALLKLPWGDPFTTTSNQLLGEESAGGYACYKVVGSKRSVIGSSGRKDTFWIDKKSFLLRQYRMVAAPLDVRQVCTIDKAS